MSEGGTGRKPKRRMRQGLSRPTHLLQPLYDTNHLDASYDRYVMFLLLSAGLKKTGHTAKGQHVFLTVQPHISMRDIEDLVKKVFVSGARRVSMEYVPVATAVAMKKSTALVVSLGERHTFVSPVIHGELYSNGILRSAICGHLITHFLQHVLLGDTVALPTVRFLKETRAHIANAFKEEEQEQRGQIMNVRTALGTKESVPLHYLITCGEPYFRPKSIIKHYFGLDAIPELRRRAESVTKAASVLELGSATPATLISSAPNQRAHPSSSTGTLSSTNSANDLPSRSQRNFTSNRGSSRGELVDLVSSNTAHSEPSLTVSDDAGRRSSSASHTTSTATSSQSSGSSLTPGFCELDWFNGLHQLVLASIALCPPEYHIELIKNIVIEGEGGKFSGLADRLRLELEKSLKRVEAVITVCPSNVAWRGSAILSSTLHSRTITREEFQESYRSRARALGRLYHSKTPKAAMAFQPGSSFSGGEDGGIGTLTDSAGGYGATDGSDSAPGSGRILSPSGNSGRRVVNRFASGSGNVTDLASAPVRRVSGHNLDFEDLVDLRDSTGSLGGGGSAGPSTPTYGASNHASSSSNNLTASHSDATRPSVVSPTGIRRVVPGQRRGASASLSASRSADMDDRFGDPTDLRSFDIPPSIPDLEHELMDPPPILPQPIASTSSPTLPSSSLPDTTLPELVDLAPSASAPSGLARIVSRRRSTSKKKIDSNTSSASTATPSSNGNSSPRSNSTSSTATSQAAPTSRKIRRGSVKSKGSSAKSDRSRQMEDGTEDTSNNKERSPRPSKLKHTDDKDAKDGSKDSKDTKDVKEREKDKEKERRTVERASLRDESDDDSTNSLKRSSALARNGSDSEGAMDIDEVDETSADIISESAISSEMVRRYRRHIKPKREDAAAEEDDSLSLSLSGSLAISNSSSISSTSMSSASNHRRVMEPRLRRLSLGLEEIDRSNIERQSSSPSISVDASPPPRRVPTRSASGGRSKALSGSKKWRTKLSEVDDLATSSSNSSIATTSPPQSISLRIQPASSSGSIPRANASSSSSPHDEPPLETSSPSDLTPKSSAYVDTGASYELPLSGRITGESTFPVHSQQSNPALSMVGLSASLPTPTASSTPTPPESTRRVKKTEKKPKKRESSSALDVRSSHFHQALTPLTTAPHLDSSPDHIKNKPDLPPKPSLNRTELVIQFVQPMGLLLKAYWQWLQDYYTPFIRHQLRDREFLEQYVVPRYQKFIYLKNNVDPETARHIHPDIFIEIAWQAHMCRPLQYRAFSTKHCNGRVIAHDLLDVRLAHQLEKTELDIMQRQWKKAFGGESFLKTMPTTKMIYQEMQTVPVSTSAPHSTSSASSASTTSLSAVTAASSSAPSGSTPSGNPSPLSSDTAVSPVVASNSPRTLPSTDYITSTAYQSSGNTQSTTGSSGNVTTGTSSPRVGSNPSVVSSSGSLPATAVASSSAAPNASTNPKPVRSKHRSKNEPALATQTVPTLRFNWKKETTASGSKSSAKMPTLPDFDFDLAGAILEDLESTEVCTSSLRKASQGAFSRKNWSHHRTQFVLIKSYEMFFYLLLKYGNKHSQPYFRPPPYLAVVARAHMCFPHLYVSDCRKYRGHLVGMGPLILADGLTAAQSFEKTRKLFLVSGLAAASKLRNRPDDMMKVLSEEEFGGVIENVVKPCPVLPPEIMARIFKALPTRSADPGYVCQSWHSSMAMPDVWKSYVARDFPDAMTDLPSDPRGYRPYYNEKLREAIGGAVIFDFGAAKVRCGTAKDGLARTSTTDSSTRNSSDDSSSSDSELDGEHGFHSTDYAVSGHGPADDSVRLAPRYIYQAVVRRAISKRK